MPKGACGARKLDPRDNGNAADFYIIRVTQMNGQMAWSSPVQTSAKAK